MKIFILMFILLCGCARPIDPCVVKDSEQHIKDCKLIKRIQLNNIKGKGMWHFNKITGDFSRVIYNYYMPQNYDIVFNAYCQIKIDGVVVPVMKSSTLWLCKFYDNVFEQTKNDFFEEFLENTEPASVIK